MKVVFISLIFVANSLQLSHSREFCFLSAKKTCSNIFFISLPSHEFHYIGLVALTRKSSPKFLMYELYEMIHTMIR